VAPCNSYFSIQVGEDEDKKKNKKKSGEHEARVAQHAWLNVRLYGRVIIKVHDDR
jgi:hypothetical protein